MCLFCSNLTMAFCSFHPSALHVSLRQRNHVAVALGLNGGHAHLRSQEDFSLLKMSELEKKTNALARHVRFIDPETLWHFRALVTGGARTQIKKHPGFSVYICMAGAFCVRNFDPNSLGMSWFSCHQTFFQYFCHVFQSFSSTNAR